jgi:hypothetical protein
VGFVYHDKLREDEQVNPRTILDTGLDIDSFYLAAATYPDDFSADAYGAAKVGEDFVGRYPV